MNETKTKLVAGCLAVAIGALATGCNSGNSDSNGGAPTDSGVAEAESWATTTPSGTGELDSVTWGLPYGEPSTLDYLRAAAFSENQVLSSVCEGLLRTKPDLTVEPSLAESVEHPNPTTYIYKLRPNAEFSNGDPLTADDAVFSLKRNVDPNSGSFWASWFVNVKNIVATDDHTVTVTLKEPDEVFNEFMATAAGTIVQKTFVEGEGKKFGGPDGGLMCTGPYVLANWTPGESITVDRNDNYWDTEHLAKAKKIKFVFVTDSSALTAALKSGEIDGAYDTPISLKSSDAGTVYLGKSTQFTLFSFTRRSGPAQDVRIRKALSLVIDRVTIARQIFSGSAVGLFGFYPPASWSYSRDIFEAQLKDLPSPDRVDLDAAKALVQEYTDQKGKPADLNLAINGSDPSQSQLGTYVASQAEQVGLHVKVAPLPANQLIQVSFDPKLRERYDMFSGSGYIDVADPLAWVIWALTPDGLFNSLGYDNPKVVKLVDEARRTSDDDTRAQLLGQIQKIAYGEDYVQLHIANVAARVYLGKRVTGVPASLPSYLYYPWPRSLGAAG